MSNAGHGRTRTEHDRGPSTTFGARSRATFSRMGARERPPSSGEVIPEDSASNGPHRRAPSGSQRPNGLAKDSSEQHKTNLRVTTRDSLQMRTRSPVKGPPGDDAEDIFSRGAPRQSGQTVPKATPPTAKEKKPICSLRDTSCLKGQVC